VCGGDTGLYLCRCDGGKDPGGDSNGAGASVYSDGSDRLFDDLGDDRLVGGTDKDHAFAGWGDDLINMDDDRTRTRGLNSQADTGTSFEGVAYGSVGGSTDGHRLIDWLDEV